MRTVLLVALSLACIATGCSPSTGPSVTQSREGQVTTDSVLNKVTLTDDVGTTAAEVAGPTQYIRQTQGETFSTTTGMVTRTLTINRNPDGSVNMSLNSGSDAKGVIVADPTTGNVTRFEYDTNSSAPLDALGRLQREYQATFQALSADKRAVAEAQAAAFVESLEKLSPTLAALAKGLLGLP